jgi:hypothetical protein
MTVGVAVVWQPPVVGPHQQRMMAALVERAEGVQEVRGTVQGPG